MKLNSKIKKISSVVGNWYEFYNNKNEKIHVEISETHCNPKDKKCLPNLWVKHGFVKKPIYDYLTVDTYVYTEIGCFEKYNPTANSITHKLNFKWLLEATNENKIKLLNEVYRLSNL